MVLLKPEPRHRSEWLLKLRLGTTEELTSAPKHRVGLSLKEGNLWQLRERNDAEWEIRVVGVQNGIFMLVGSSSGSNISLEHEQNGSDKFVILDTSFTNKGLVSGSLTYDTMPCRQRGHAIAPGGP